MSGREKTARPRRALDGNLPHCLNGGKVSYRTRRQATVAKDRILNARHRLHYHVTGKSGERFVYRCRYCGAWHLTGEEQR